MRVCVCARNFHTHTNTHTQLVPPSRARRPVCVYFTITIYNTSRKFCAAAPRTAAKKKTIYGHRKNGIHCHRWLRFCAACMRISSSVFVYVSTIVHYSLQLLYTFLLSPLRHGTLVFEIENANARAPGGAATAFGRVFAQRQHAQHAQHTHSLLSAPVCRRRRCRRRCPRTHLKPFAHNVVFACFHPCTICTTIHTS